MINYINNYDKEEITTEDLETQLLDLQKNLEALREERDQLQELYKKRQEEKAKKEEERQIHEEEMKQVRELLAAAVLEYCLVLNNKPRYDYADETVDLVVKIIENAIEPEIIKGVKSGANLDFAEALKDFL